jgi:hypothetical protein
LARKILTIEQAEAKFMRRRTIHLHAAGTAQALGPVAESLVSVVRAADPAGGSMRDVAKHATKEYGARFGGFVEHYVNPALVARGYAEARQEKVLGVIGLTRHYRTPAGEDERSRLESIVRDPHNILRCLEAVGLDLSCFDGIDGGFRAFDDSYEAATDLG